MDSRWQPQIASLLAELNTTYDPFAEEASRQRLAAVYIGQEADFLPIIYDAPAHDVAIQADLHEQFFSPEAMLVAHLRRLVAVSSVPQDGLPCIRPNLGVVFVPSVFGLEPEVPPDVMPRFREHLTREQVWGFGLPADITTCGLVRRAIDIVRFFREVVGDRVHVYMPDTQGIFDIAHLVRGNDLFTEMYDDPAQAHALLELCLQAYLQTTRALKDAIGEPAESGYHGHGMVSGIYMAHGGVRVSEDTPTLLRPRHIDEFVVPYIVRALQPFGGGFVHYCGRNDHLFRALLAIPEVRGINLGNPEKHDPAAYMAAVLDQGKFYFGSWPRIAGEPLREYLARMLALAGGHRKGLIFLLTPAELGADSPAEAVHLWRELQDRRI